MKTDAAKTDTADLITQAEAARIRGTTREAIYDLVSRGKLSTIEIGGQKFLKRSEVKNYSPQPAGRPRRQSAARLTTKTEAKKNRK